jgi:ribosomal protein S18 acetylase RimI-like enzyme
MGVRHAELGDIPSLIALHERCWRISYAGIADADAKFARPRAEWERVWREILDRTWVAEEGGAIAGFVVFGASRDAEADARTGEIQALYVDPDRQGGGFGRLLADHAASALAADGYRRVTLWTFEHNPASRGFYARLGFAFDGTASRDEDGAIVRYARRLPRP